MPKSIISTFMQMLELAVIIGLVYLVGVLFPGLIPSESIKMVVLVALAGVAKLARASDSPIPDYVNGAQS